jgi:tubulin polyglutamylase TTLL9
MASFGGRRSLRASSARSNTAKQQQQHQQQQQQHPLAALPSRPTVTFRCASRNIAHEVMRSRPGWVETNDDIDWDINWADVAWIRDMHDQIQLDEQQRINHYCNHYELTRKDLMVKNLKRMKRQLQKSDCGAEAAAYDFW